MDDFLSTLKLTNIALIISGVEAIPTEWSNSINRYFGVRWLFYINFFWLYTDLAAQYYWFYDSIMSGGNFLEVAMVAPCNFLSLLGTMKTGYLFYNLDKVRDIIQNFKEIHPKFDVDNAKNTNDDEQETVSEKERYIVNQSTKFVIGVTKLLYSVNGFCTVAFGLLPIIMMGKIYKETGNVVAVYPFLTKYFFDHNKMLWWPFVYVHHILSSLIVFCNVIGADTLFFALCIYLQMHFRLLYMRFENIANPDEPLRIRLTEAVKRHHLLIQLVEDVEELYTNAMLFNIMISSILICFSGFEVTFSEDKDAVFSYLTFLFMSLSQISLLCYFGDLLMYSSAQTSEAVYYSKWYDADEYNKKTILLVLMRMQKPCKFTAAKFADINLMTFTTVRSLRLHRLSVRVSGREGRSYVTMGDVHCYPSLTCSSVSLGLSVRLIKSMGPFSLDIEHISNQIMSRSWSYFAMLKTMYS